MGSNRRKRTKCSESDISDVHESTQPPTTSTKDTSPQHFPRFILVESPWVLNFPPCRGPGGSIPIGNVASVVSSNCPLWEERRQYTIRLPWVAARKPEEGILEVESYWKFGLS